jgi:hypothetical protein
MKIANRLTVDRLTIIRLTIVVFGLLLIPATAVVTAAVKQRFADGPNQVFSGGPLESGTIYVGQEPDWSLVRDVQTIELQLLDPPRSRRIWTAEYDGKIYVWSGYIATAVGRVWKRWPLQAERDGRAMMRIDGKRYERQLVRIKSGPILDGISAAIRNKYPSQTTRATVEAGETWLFEAAPRN